MNTRAWSTIVAVFCSIALPVTARSQPANANIEVARQHAERGQAALAANNFQLALDEYEQAHRLYPNPLLLINVAAAQSGLGRIEAAIETLRDVRGSDAVDDARKREVDAEISRLQRLLAVLDIRTDPAGARVSINGTERGTTPITISVQPGPVRVRLVREGYRPLEWDNDGHSLRQSERKSVDLDLVPVPSATPDVGPEGARIEEQPDLHLGEPRDSGGISPTWVWVSAITAGALAIGGSVFGIMRMTEQSDAPAGCDIDAPAPGDCQDFVNDADTHAMLSTILFAGAGVAAAAAIILFTQMGDASPEETAQALNDLRTLRF